VQRIRSPAVLHCAGRLNATDGRTTHDRHRAEHSSVETMPACRRSSAPARSTAAGKDTRSSNAFTKKARAPRPRTAVSYSRQRDKLCEELTLAKIEHHTEAVDELDVEGILAFAERILPRASDLWVQASLDYKQRLQQLFFPEGIAFDGNRFNRTAATAPLSNYLAPSESADEKMVSRVGIEPTTRRLRVCENLAATSRGSGAVLCCGL
jgi:hypothetical protein